MDLTLFPIITTHRCQLANEGLRRPPRTFVKTSVALAQAGERQKVGGPVLATSGPRCVEQLAESIA
jgi:hypothetical protein